MIWRDAVLGKRVVEIANREEGRNARSFKDIMYDSIVLARIQI
jgi:hypothetical protein